MPHHRNTTHVNHLAHEKSPYLRQHAANPVDWYPWGDATFERAQAEDKPLFLSIGYSTCHWCHVMAEESFEDPTVAALMNETFISVKVDREERPDIDAVYMEACRMMTGTGGWPLTVIMTPEKKPFYAATYIPKESRAGLTGLMDLIPRIAVFWREQRETVIAAAERMTELLNVRTQEESTCEPAIEEFLTGAFRHLTYVYDHDHGGFGTAPKFPVPHHLIFLLRYAHRTGNKDALAMVEKTLLSMRAGGIYDHIGFGFHRYSTDAAWRLPHFEKMLSDQALLAFVYAEAFHSTGNIAYGQTADEVCRYVLRDMSSPEGTFYTAEDADSDGVEGKYYLWHADEIETVLEKDEARLIRDVFTIRDEGNLHMENAGDRGNANILFLRDSLDDAARRRHMTPDAFYERLDAARRLLSREREKRTRPHRDTKILTDWNGLMIAALAAVGRILFVDDYVKAAARCADFLWHAHRTPEETLLHRSVDGRAGIPAYLDDYAFFIWGLIELYAATYDPLYLERAQTLLGVVRRHFEDPERSSFFFTADDGETLITRRTEMADMAIPSGQAVVLWNAARLGLLTGDQALTDTVFGFARHHAGELEHNPAAYTGTMIACDLAYGPSRVVVVVGHDGAADTCDMISAVRDGYHPRTLLIFREANRDSPLLSLAPYTRDMTLHHGRATAYVCTENMCLTPTTDTGKLATLIG